MGNAAGGVHAAAIGGLWQAMVLGFGGLSVRPGGLSFRPRLLPHWRRLAFPLQWQGRKIHVAIGAAELRLKVESGNGPLRVAVDENEEVEIQPQQEYVVARRPGGWRVRGAYRECVGEQLAGAVGHAIAQDAIRICSVIVPLDGGDSPKPLFRSRANWPSWSRQPSMLST